MCGNLTNRAGITIGDNCTIVRKYFIQKTNNKKGAGSVVTKDIPANSVAFGNPAKVKKQV